MRSVFLSLLAALAVGSAFVLSGCDSNEPEGFDELVIEDLVVGTGAEAKEGDTLSVDYYGTLADGTFLDASVLHGGPFEFVLGAGQVIEGWDEGMKGMRVGGKRKLYIPADMAYGPSTGDLIFEVDLRAVNAGP